MKYSVDEYDAIYQLGRRMIERAISLRHSMESRTSIAETALIDLGVELQSIAQGNK